MQVSCQVVAHASVRRQSLAESSGWIKSGRECGHLRTTSSSEFCLAHCSRKTDAKKSQGRVKQHVKWQQKNRMLVAWGPDCLSQPFCLSTFPRATNFSQWWCIPKLSALKLSFSLWFVMNVFSHYLSQCFTTLTCRTSCSITVLGYKRAPLPSHYKQMLLWYMLQVRDPTRYDV